MPVEPQLEPDAFIPFDRLTTIVSMRDLSAMAGGFVSSDLGSRTLAECQKSFIRDFNAWAKGVCGTINAGFNDDGHARFTVAVPNTSTATQLALQAWLARTLEAAGYFAIIEMPEDSALYRDVIRVSVHVRIVPAWARAEALL